MTVGYEAKSQVLWGSEIFLSDSILFALLKWANSDYLEFFDEITEFWQQDDDKVFKANAPLKLSQLCCLSLLRSADTEDDVYAQLQENSAALIAWNMFVENVKNCTIDAGAKEQNDDKLDEHLSKKAKTEVAGTTQSHEKDNNVESPKKLGWDLKNFCVMTTITTALFQNHHS